jgi:hypothetical protein
MEEKMKEETRIYIVPYEYHKKGAHFEDLDIKGDLTETGWERVNWLHLA